MSAQFDKFLHCIQISTKHESHAVHSSEEIADQGKLAARHIGEQNCGSPGSKDAAVDGGRFQVGINRLLDANQLAASLQVIDALSQVPISHAVGP